MGKSAKCEHVKIISKTAAEMSFEVSKKSPKTKTYSSSLSEKTVHTSSSRRTSIFTVHVVDFRFGGLVTLAWTWNLLDFSFSYSSKKYLAAALIRV